MPNPTFEELSASLPESAVESTTRSGEVVVYTGWMVNAEDPDGPLVEWIDEDA